MEKLSDPAGWSIAVTFEPTLLGQTDIWSVRGRFNSTLCQFFSTPQSSISPQKKKDLVKFKFCFTWIIVSEHKPMDVAEDICKFAHRWCYNYCFVFCFFMTVSYQLYRHDHTLPQIKKFFNRNMGLFTMLIYVTFGKQYYYALIIMSWVGLYWCITRIH